MIAVTKAKTHRYPVVCDVHGSVGVANTTERFAIARAFDHAVATGCREAVISFIPLARGRSRAIVHLSLEYEVELLERASFPVAREAVRKHLAKEEAAR